MCLLVLLLLDDLDPNLGELGLEVLLVLRSELLEFVSELRHRLAFLLTKAAIHRLRERELFGHFISGFVVSIAN